MVPVVNTSSAQCSSDSDTLFSWAGMPSSAASSRMSPLWMCKQKAKKRTARKMRRIYMKKKAKTGQACLSKHVGKPETRLGGTAVTIPPTKYVKKRRGVTLLNECGPRFSRCHRLYGKVLDDLNS